MVTNDAKMVANDTEMVTKVAKMVAKVAKNDANLALPPRFRQVLIESPLELQDDNACTPPIMTDKDILEVLQRSKSIIGADSGEENKVNNVAPFPTSSEMRNIMKRQLRHT
ncbi:hypothetical protein TNCV_1159121 [Trichonephila clavipes]|nr:hypothetical protein TNCV_1159121 [Trichonephila clavipes]